MRRMPLLPLTAIVLAALAGPSSAASGQHRPENALRHVLQQDADSVVEAGSPGILAQLSTGDGSIKIRSGYGDVAQRSPVPWSAQFRIASFSKTFVATTLLQLVGEGRLSLDDSVDKWLPGRVSGNGNDGSKITVRQLLQHTSGLPDYMLGLLPIFTEPGFRQHRFDAHNSDELVALAMRYPPTFAPGTDWRYSNTNYVLAGMIITKVTGRDWRAEVHDRIIDRLHLDHTFIPGARTRLPNPHAIGYQRFPDDPESANPFFGAFVDVTELNPSFADAAGEIISTTDDGNRFLRALIGGRLLASAQLKEMQNTVPAPELAGAWPGARYGLGLLWTPNSCGGAWAHAGDIQGFQTRNGVSPDGKRSVMVSLNTDSVIPKDSSTIPSSPVDPSAKLIDHALCGVK
ncbi:serine hydrolase domain-containing protein [Amycolatopsis sp. NPDC051061]|uniref:serine hydrolase domain-containing protein n=1 Tax=Amycolatopsis sp. NPDC051061 TaxID=3155042 RepID=UPI0034420FBD